MLQLPCPSVDSEKVMRTVPSDLVELKKYKNLRGSMRKTQVSEVCCGPGPRRCSFFVSASGKTEDQSRNLLCETLSNCWVPLGETGFCGTSLKMIFIRYHRLRSHNNDSSRSPSETGLLCTAAQPDSGEVVSFVLFPQGWGAPRRPSEAQAGRGTREADRQQNHR